MALPNNVLQTVVTYQMSGLAFLQNLFCFVSTSNSKFKDFDRLTANLGDSVSFDLPPRYITNNSLVAQFQSSQQRVQTLTVSNSVSTSYDFTAQQFLFNVRDYMKRFGMAAVREIGTKVEANVAGNCESGPYRFFGDGVTPINSFGQLAQALAQFRNFGTANDMAKGYLSDIAIPAIANSGLNQFAPDRNNKMANSWQLGEFSDCTWYKSNLLPIHTAGSEGQYASTLTVVSVLQNSDGGVYQITFSGTHAASDGNSVKLYDRFQFQDGVAGQPNLRFRTFVGHEVAAVPVQFRATADAGSTGGSQVTVDIYPALQAAAGQNQNISVPIVAGMQVKVLPSHRVGMITSGDPLYLAMPRLPEEVPFPTANEMDPETGISIRQYYGSLFGQNQRGMVHDCIWGSTLVPEYSIALIFPL